MKTFQRAVPQAHIQKIIQHATLAPSGHNTQPWKFSYQDNTISILPDYSRRLPVVDADNHALFISLGCALENLVITANHLGYRATVDLFSLEQEDACITVVLEEVDKPAGNGLFEAIKKRQSTRSEYEHRPIPADDLEKIKKAAAEADVELLFFSGEEEKKKLLPFIIEGNIKQFSNKAFTDELSSWIRFNRSAATETGDGLFGGTMGYPSTPAWLGKFFMSNFTSPAKEARKVARLAQGSAALLLFVAASHSKKAWVHVGRSFERTALTASLLNIKHAHVNMPCEEVAVRKKLQQYLNLGEKQPLLLIRMGYGKAMPYSFRRPLEAVLTR